MAWGTLDIYSYRRKKQDYQFWCRPSNVFYSITHVANINHKLPSPCFSHWFKTHDIPAQFPSEQLKALKKGTNFSNCPWENMINKRTKSKNLLVSLQTDWNKSNSDTSWSNRWNMSNYIKNTSPIVDTQWSNNYSQILNKSNTSYDGLLTLKDRYMMEDILSPNTENSETLYRLLPFCAKTRHFSAPPMGDPSANHIQFDSHLLKAVIISSNKSYIPMKVLAICCDWINTIPNQDSDALPINKQFKKEGGINDTDLVNKPEFSRIPKDYFRVDTLKGSICWNSDSLNTNLDLNEEIPLSEIAILAKNNNFTIKAIIAIPANHKIKKTARITAFGAQASSLNQNIPEQFIPLNYNFESVGQITPLPNLETGVTLNGKKQLYNLYTVTMTASSSPKHILRQGWMGLQWYFYPDDTSLPIATDYTEITKISTTIGPSTWHTNGTWQQHGTTYNDSVQLWQGVCDFFHSKLFDSKTRNRALEYISLNYDMYETFAPLHDEYFTNNPSAIVDFRKTVAIGMLNNFKHEATSHLGQWTGQYSTQYRTDDLNNPKPSILHINKLVSDALSTEKITLLCFETAYTFAVVTRLIGDSDIGVTKEPGTHAWNTDNNHIYDASSPDRLLTPYHPIFSADTHPHYANGEPHESIELQ